MKLVTVVSLLTISFISFSSCGFSDCYNKNPVFSQFKPETETYKKELASQLQKIGQDDLHCVFECYIKRDGKEFILVKVKGEDLCASAELTVTDWSKIAGMRREPSGYSGAEMKGLRILIKQEPDGTSLIFNDVKKVID